MQLNNRNVCADFCLWPWHPVGTRQASTDVKSLLHGVQALGQASNSGVPDAQALFMEPEKPGSDLSQRLNAVLRCRTPANLRSSGGSQCIRPRLGGCIALEA